MGMLYGAQVQTMMPKLHSTNFEGMERSIIFWKGMARNKAFYAEV